MTSISPVMCRACERLLDTGKTTPTMPGEAPRRKIERCGAFPSGIPVGIALGGGDHREAFAGDNGVRFKQANTEEALQAFEEWRVNFGE